METKILWHTDNNYQRYRIPGMITTKKGTILCYCEARKTPGDWAKIDILLQRSEDGGKTFDSPKILVKGTEVHPTNNNPIMMQDKKGRIHFLHCEDYTVNGGRVLHYYSDDDGLTFSEPKDISERCRPDFHNAFALGPGHGICTTSGVLVVPAWMVPKAAGLPLESHLQSVLSTLYSEDNGETWNVGDIIKTGADMDSPNEAELTEAPNHNIYINFRLGNQKYRGRAYSRSGYCDWNNVEPDKRLDDPCCFASVLTWKHLIVYAGCLSKSDRNHVSVVVSQDNGITWEKELLIDKENGGYVECTLLNDQLFVLYERGFGDTCILCQIDMNDFL